MTEAELNLVKTLQPGRPITVVLNDAGKAAVPDPHCWVINGTFLGYEQAVDYLHLHWAQEDREIAIFEGHIGFLGVQRPAQSPAVP